MAKKKRLDFTSANVFDILDEVDTDPETDEEEGNELF